jgi:multidrug efflux pump subunit AcrA (membrane-fusion protein)
MRIGWVLLVVGVLALALAVIGLATREPEGKAGGGAPPYVLPVTLVRVEQADFRGRIELTGTVRSRRSAALAFETDGRIAELEVREGDRVEAGAVLARLDGAAQRLAELSSEASLALARSELAKLEAGVRAEEKLRLEAALAEAQALAAWSASDLARARTLRDQEVGSQATVERLEAELRAAEARVAAAQAELDQARAGTRLEDLEVARARVAVAEAALASARERLEKTELAAPWAGAVVARLASAGEHVDAGESVVELVDLSRREIAVEVPSRWAAEVRPGGRVLVRLDEAPGFTLEAVISARAPAAEEASRNFRALVDVEGDPAGVLAPGMFARLAVDLTPIPGALVVPSDAVRTTEQGAIVVRADPAPAAAAAGPGAGGPDAGGPGAGGSGAPHAGPQPPSLVAAWVPVRVLASADGKSAVQTLGPPLAAGDQLVLTGVDVAFPGAALLPRMAGAPGAASAAAGGAAR